MNKTIEGRLQRLEALRADDDPPARIDVVRICGRRKDCPRAPVVGMSLIWDPESKRYRKEHYPATSTTSTHCEACRDDQRT